jgi:hypothetical protein
MCGFGWLVPAISWNTIGWDTHHVLANHFGVASGLGNCIHHDVALSIG